MEVVEFRSKRFLSFIAAVVYAGMFLFSESLSVDNPELLSLFQILKPNVDKTLYLRLNAVLCCYSCTEYQRG